MRKLSVDAGQLISYNFHKQSPIMLTDTHCHIDHAKFDGDREAVIVRALEAGLSRLLVPALHLQSAKDALKLAESNVSVYAAVGFHPNDLGGFSESAFEEIKTLAQHPKVVAVGEIGLDYYWEKEAEGRAVQREILKRQLEFAKEINKPVIIHMREENDAWSGEASQDLMNILEKWQSELQGALAEHPGVLHSFNGTLGMAEKAIGLNFFIGVTGPVTYKKADEKRDVIKQLPITKLLIETDSPYLSPEPQRSKRNEPAFVRFIADKIAEIKFLRPEDVAAATSANAARLFSW